MPRVTDAHRRARQTEIAEAAVRALARRGVGSTSIADIVRESGLSAGAIYANFENKSDLARFIARDLLDWRVQRLGSPEVDGPAVGPSALLAELLTTLDSEAPPLAVILQFWGEATMDADLHAVLADKIGELRDAFERALLPWAAERAPDDPPGLARRGAITMIVLAQGYLANRGLLGWTTPEEYVRGVRDLFGA